MANFPAITPTGRSFKPGTYPQKSYRALNGVVSKRTFGNRPYGYSMDLDFSNIKDDVVVQILNHYNSQTSANQRFKLGSAVVAGLNNNLKDEAQATGVGIRWEYVEPPSVKSVHPGLSNVSVRLVGEIRDKTLDDI